jgi:phosphoribosylformimino-5-aminoimidazole carboxamide ribotide isomerase
VQRAVLGTRALKEPAWLERMARLYPGQIVLGIDARNGMVATDGWLEVSQRPAVDFGRDCAAWPLAALVYTDISKDGMMAGPNLDAMTDMARAVKLPVIASGGVTTECDVGDLAKRGLAGCIIGRALYEGTVDLKAAIRIADCRSQIAD